MKHLALFAGLLLHALPGFARDVSDFEFVQRLGAALPLQAGLQDESGHAVRLGEFFGRAPVVLVFGYFECRNLCSTVLDGVVESLARSHLPASSYRLVVVSIDPRETPALAARRREVFRPLLAADAHFLVGEAETTRRIATSAGFPYAWDATRGEYTHPAGFVVAAPDGRISRYFPGVRFETRDVRLALVEASAGGVGTLSERLLLLCSHYDPQSGRYSLAVMGAVRVLCLGIAAALGAWIWRRRRAP